ncbi:HFR023Wp [Eremothecium sinecaudum]|uniref:pH-response regulator protein palF/RIM8 n=1 Tax=Eremothecium sinecaudum TaxID=45286 RepID=A0A0X8HUY7_9SACH|nr:HFR023Wp [Eremothecium sinecaudum]AMD21878.1 HFR023Wp [Eremothecium sinecaudum]
MRLFCKLKLPKSLHLKDSEDRVPKSSTYISNFYIEIPESHGVWKPGEIISGQIVLTLKKPLKNVSLKLGLIGTLKVLSGTGATSREKARIQLFNMSTIIFGDKACMKQVEDEIWNGLTKGDHYFPFKMTVPSKNIYSSIDFERGSICYKIHCTLHSLTCTSIISECSKSFSVLVPIAVDVLPKPNTKIVVLQSPASVRGLKVPTSEHEGSISKTHRRNSSMYSNFSGATNLTQKTVTISVNLPESGFVIGETIPLQVNIQHYKEYSHPAGLVATLIRICRVPGTRNYPIETFRKDICQCVAPLCLDPISFSHSVKMNLDVPFDAFPTLIVPNHGFSFQYYIEALVNLSPKNIVYTESNKVIGGGQTSHIPVPRYLERASKRLNCLSCKLQATKGKSSAQNISHSMVSPQDMVNVRKLKRLKTVTGTCIEVVIGTHRSGTRQEPKDNNITDINGEQNLSHTAEQKGPSRRGSILETYDTIAQKHLTKSELREDFTNKLKDSLYDTEPVPLYTPNYQYSTTEDKNELERLRLYELESEPE